MQDLELIGNGLVSVEVLDAKQGMELVPLDLQRDQLRDHVVDIGRTGNIDRERVFAVVVVTAAPARRALHLPALDIHSKPSLEDLGGLAEHDAPGVDDRGREPAERIDERARVGLRRTGFRVKNRAHSDMGLLEDLQLGFAGAAQQRVVGPRIEINGVASRAAFVDRIAIRHQGYYPVPFPKPARDARSSIYIF